MFKHPLSKYVPSRLKLIAVPVALVALAGIVGSVICWQHRRFEAELTGSFQAHQLEAARHMARFTESTFQNVLDELSLGARSSSADALQAATAVRNMRELAEDVVLDLQLSTAEGEPLAYAARPMQVAQWREFQAARQEGQIVVSRPLPWDADISERVIRVCVPHKDPGGQVTAMVTANVSVRKLSAKCFAGPDRLESAARSFCWVIDDSGYIVYHTDPRLLYRATAVTADPSRIVDPSIHVALGAWREGSAEIPMPGDLGQGLVSYTPMRLGSTTYGLAVGSAKSEIAVPIIAHQRVTYALMTALVLAFGAAGYAMYRGKKTHLLLERERRQAAEASNRAKTQFLARVSRQIRTPMNGVIGMIELALDTPLAPDQHRYLTFVKQSADSLMTVINDIQDLSEVESGKLELVRTEFCLRSCVGDVLSLMDMRARDKGLELRCRIAADVPNVLVGDPGRLRQILVNLITNAVKFTQQGRVELSVTAERRTRREVVLHACVSDTGPGVPRDQRQRLFLPLEAAAQQGARYGGGGLGLVICAQLVELMGGRIWLEDASPTGSAFHFTLKLGQGGSRRLLAGDTRGLVGRRAIVVDASADGGTAVEQMLHRCGMVVSVVQSASAALDSLRLSADSLAPVDFVVLCEGGAVDCFGLASRIKRDARLGKTRVALLARAGVRGDALRCRHSGICVYLTPPVSQTVLFEALATSLTPAGSSDEGPITRHTLREGRRSLLVLVAQADPAESDDISESLRTLGHRVRLVHGGQEALAESSEHSFDVAIIDMHLPGMDALRAAAAIRRAETEGKRLPMIAMAVHATPEDRQACLDAGMDDMILKPIRPETLDSVIARVLQAQAAQAPQPQDEPATSSA